MDHKSTALHSTSPSTKQELAPHEIHAQPQSPLYSKLPFEIRMLVFQHMFREAIHVTCIGRNLVSWRCRKQSPDHMPCHWQHPCWDYRRGISNRRKGFLGILTTCKLVYHEANEMLYTEPHFHFPVALNDMRGFSNAVDFSRLSTIRYVTVDNRYSGQHIDFNKLVPQEVIARMSGLKALRIDLRQWWLASVQDDEVLQLVEGMHKLAPKAPVLEVVFDGMEDDPLWELWQERCEEGGVTLVREEFKGISGRKLMLSNIDFASARSHGQSRSYYDEVAMRNGRA